MLSSQTHLLSRILLLLFFVRVAFADTLTVTITAYPGFLSQRSCAIYCYVNAFDGQYYDLGCETPVENACYCRDDLISSWANSLSSCVSASCSGNSEDVDSATSIYEGYCSSNGYVAGAAAATTRTGNAESTTTSRGAASAGSLSGTAVQTSTTNNNAQNGGTGNNQGSGSDCGGGSFGNSSGVTINCNTKGNSGLSSTDVNAIIGSVVGVVGLVISILTLCA